MDKGKTAIIRKVLVDERGRFYRPHEFRWLMSSFRDRYDPRRLALGIIVATGLRRKDGCRVKRTDFNEDFTYLRMVQCKRNVKCKDNIIRIKERPKNVPIPQWLASDLKHYTEHRLKVGYYMGFDNPKALFPILKPDHLTQLFYKLRKRHGDEQTWLRAVWYYEEHYDANFNLLKKRTIHRIATHMGRAMYTIAASIECKGDLSATRLISGHERIKDVERYTRYAEVEDKKQAVCDKHIEPLMNEQKIPLSKDQKTLLAFQ